MLFLKHIACFAAVDASPDRENRFGSLVMLMGVSNGKRCCLVDMSKDPTKDPEFQRVVQTFLHTKPQPHKPTAKVTRKRKAVAKVTPKAK
jgi:hypothetical protein